MSMLNFIKDNSNILNIKHLVCTNVVWLWLGFILIMEYESFPFICLLIGFPDTVFLLKSFGIMKIKF